jgi:hypothetical protein
MSKDKHIKKPQTADEAMDAIFTIGKKFGLQIVIISPNDFEDMMGTEGWTKEQTDRAVEMATDEVSDQVGFALDNAIESINKR